MFGYKLIRESEYDFVKSKLLSETRRDNEIFTSFMLLSKAVGIMLRLHPDMQHTFDNCYRIASTNRPKNV